MGFCRHRLQTASKLFFSFNSNQACMNPNAAGMGHLTTAPSQPVGPLIMHHARQETTPTLHKQNPKLSLLRHSARQTSACHDLDLSPSYRRAEKDILEPARPPRGSMPWPRHPAIQLLRPRAKAEGLANCSGRQSHMDRPRLAGSEDHDTTTHGVGTTPIK